MPNRILRDCTDSDKINSLSVYAERFIYRLFMKADDFGCFYADARLLKAHLFPLQLDSIREADISRWIAECEKSGLIVLYETSGKKYLEILEFNQQLRQKRRKFPDKSECDQHDSNMIAGCSPETNPKRIRKETEVEVEVPPIEVFLEYCQQNLKSAYPDLRSACEMKYKSWVANKWHNGNGKKIINWKTSILNTLPHLKPIYKPTISSEVVE